MTHLWRRRVSGSDPARHSGREPTEARSALGMRATLSVVAGVATLVAAVVLWLTLPEDGDARTGYVWAIVICLVVLVVALVDLVAIARRRAR